VCVCVLCIGSHVRDSDFRLGAAVREVEVSKFSVKYT